MPARAQDAEAAKRSAQEAEAKKKLDGVRAEIRALTEQQRAASGARDDATRALREKDIALGAVARDVHALDERMAAQQRQVDALDAQRAKLDLKLNAQRDALAGLLRSAYALGHGEELKLLLQQDDVATLSRVLA
jgi:septal ring factor EnvC (AmiA/AmiB activator)